MPAVERLSTDMRSISQRVAPSASAASFSDTGANREDSRQIAVTIGRTMIASTMPRSEIGRPEERPGEHAADDRDASEPAREVIGNGMKHGQEGENAPEAVDDARHAAKRSTT